VSSSPQASRIKRAEQYHGELLTIQMRDGGVVLGPPGP